MAALGILLFSHLPELGDTGRAWIGIARDASRRAWARDLWMVVRDAGMGWVTAYGCWDPRLFDLSRSRLSTLRSDHLDEALLSLVFL